MGEWVDVGVHYKKVVLYFEVDSITARHQKGSQKIS